MATKRIIAQRLAATLLAGAWEEPALLSRMAEMLGRNTRISQQRLVAEIFGTLTTNYPPAPSTLVNLLLSSRMFDRAAKPALKLRFGSGPHLVQPVLTPPQFTPAPRFAELDVPRIATPGDLAAWLELSLGQLDWLADTKQQHARAETQALQHYHYAFLPKRSGAPRLIEEPKSRLKNIQRRILREILDLVPVHESAHGFVRGRSCFSSAQVHAGEYAVVALDLQNFFPSVSAKHIHGLFRSLGYPWAVARLLTGLCTTATPRCVLAREKETNGLDWQARKLFETPHLAQGAPASPALANLCAWSLDRRLSALAHHFGANHTRYADDIAFSGDRAFAKQLRPFLAAVETIVADAGFALNPGKTRIMRASGRQRITGIVVNSHVNVDRDYFDRLKATLHNCAKLGAAGQNREDHPDFRAHLEGRVGWVESLNLARGMKLRKIFDEIVWPV